MPSNYKVLADGKIKAWVKGVLFEEQAQNQLHNIAMLPFIHKWIAAMPDVHKGTGATIGSVIPTIGAVIPAAVGVDIGCGMQYWLTRWTASDLPTNLSAMHDRISAAVPNGRSDNGGTNDRGAWGTPPEEMFDAWQPLARAYLDIVNKYPKIHHSRAINHLGTLGTGNHFIEVCLDEQDRVCVVLHSGSRGVGNRIGQYFIALAKEDMRKWFINLPDADLAYLPEGTDHFTHYVTAMTWAQEYARVNRDMMMRTVANVMLLLMPDPLFKTPATVDHPIVIDCHHNYMTRERHYGHSVLLTRKGAVCAREGALGIIPGSMGARSYIVRGKGNPESFNSCSHGAGRAMSRTEARKQFTVEDHKRATEGVTCRKDKDVIDETPGAYKDIDKVMEAQADLVEIVHTLRQVVCVKG